MAMTGMATARNEPMNRKMMMTTMISVSPRVLMTSWMALLMYSVAS